MLDVPSSFTNEQKPSHGDFRQTRTQIFIECTLYSSLPPDIILRNTKIPIIVRWNLKSSDISRLIWCCWWVSPHLHTPSPANPLYTGVGGGESFPWHKSYVILQLTLFIRMSVTLFQIEDILRWWTLQDVEKWLRNLVTWFAQTAFLQMERPTTWYILQPHATFFFP